VACNRLDKIFIVISSSKSCANLSIPEFHLLLFRSSFCAIFRAWLISSFLGRSIYWILISVLHVVCGRSARDPRTVREKIFRADSPRFNHGQSNFSGCGSVGLECFFG
jgi:hypothetical protein